MTSGPFQEVTNKKTSKKFPRQTTFKLLRLGFLGSVCAALIWILWNRSQTFTSRQAVVNATVMTVYPPRQGKLSLNAIEPGLWLEAGTEVGRLENPLNPQLVVDQQTTISQIKEFEAQIQSLAQRIEGRQALLNQFQAESRQQSGLQQRYQAERVTQLEKELEASKSAARAASLEAERYRFLYENGGITLSLADQVQATAEQAQAVVQRQEAALAQIRTEQQASAQGLQLEGSRVFSYPDIRVRELLQEIEDLQQQQAEARVSLIAKQEELLKINEQLSLAQSIPIRAPITGAVWSLNKSPTKIPEYVNVDDSIFQILDCDDIWVDAFLAEEQLEYIAVGDRVDVRFLGNRDRTRYSGYIVNIRSGTGRLDPGDDVAVPPAEMVRRELDVRIRLEGSDVPSTEFCGVGRSAEVTFQKPE
ncbi:HlyD family efflux transporter periplasmic adaptor subunit [Synechococcus moorigangaii CMS01]|nr:HlyD family efflux transporter periplasmic adaptor subunit [Synechococcus moorigangaii CMS01]